MTSDIQGMRGLIFSYSESSRGSSRSRRMGMGMSFFLYPKLVSSERMSTLSGLHGVVETTKGCIHKIPQCFPVAFQIPNPIRDYQNKNFRFHSANLIYFSSIFLFSGILNYSFPSPNLRRSRRSHALVTPRGEPTFCWLLKKNPTRKIPVNLTAFKTSQEKAQIKRWTLPR